MISQIEDDEKKVHLEKIIDALSQIGKLEDDMVREHKRLKQTRIETEDTKKLCKEMLSQIQSQAMTIQEKEEEIKHHNRIIEEDENIIAELEKVTDETCKRVVQDVLRKNSDLTANHFESPLLH